MKGEFLVPLELLGRRQRVPPRHRVRFTRELPQVLRRRVLLVKRLAERQEHHAQLVVRLALQRLLASGGREAGLLLGRHALRRIGRRLLHHTLRDLARRESPQLLEAHVVIDVGSCLDEALVERLPVETVDEVARLRELRGGLATRGGRLARGLLRGELRLLELRLRLPLRLALRLALRRRLPLVLRHHRGVEPFGGTSLEAAPDLSRLAKLGAKPRAQPHLGVAHGVCHHQRQQHERAQRPLGRHRTRATRRRKRRVRRAQRTRECGRGLLGGWLRLGRRPLHLWPRDQRHWQRIPPLGAVGGSEVHARKVGHPEA
mmetsp:Transcript_33832/g.89045  ORF Transcript_33832/g.89045 Transcript_33832/m.89045 type:complete len:317 (+) Transcript_33832:941-1891(+)